MGVVYHHLNSTLLGEHNFPLSTRRTYAHTPKIDSQSSHHHVFRHFLFKAWASIRCACNSNHFPASRALVNLHSYFNATRTLNKLPPLTSTALPWLAMSQKSGYSIALTLEILALTELLFLLTALWLLAKLTSPTRQSI